MLLVVLIICVVFYLSNINGLGKKYEIFYENLLFNKYVKYDNDI